MFIQHLRPVMCRRMRSWHKLAGSPGFSAFFERRQSYGTDTHQSHLPYGDTGAGTFGQRLAKQNDTYLLKGEILKAVDSITVSSTDKVFTLGDYGTADGATSIPLLRDLIALIRRKWKEIPIQIIYEDQSTNDFNSLFKRVYGEIPDPPTYMKDFEDVFPLASATSFYHQIIPDNTAHLLTSFTSIQWLSKRPTVYHDGLWRSHSTSEDERKLVTAQVARDWETFLLCRAKELKKGGLLIVTTVAEQPGVQPKGAVEYGILSMLKVWREMRDEGKITTEEYINTNFDACPYYLEELRAPFEDSKSAVHKAGLRLIDAYYTFPPCLAKQDWQEKLEKEGVDDRVGLGKTLARQFQCWSNSVFTQGLDSSRSDSEKQSLADELFSRLETEMAALDPTEIEYNVVIGYVFARKV